MDAGSRSRLRAAASSLVVAVVGLVLLAPLTVTAAPASAAPGRHPDPGATTRQAVSTARVTAPSRARAVDPDPLDVELTSLSPAVIPRSGPIQLVGTVRNDSTQTWRDINVHAYVSTTPITTSADLATAAATPADADVGQRLTSAHAFVAVGALAPGEQTGFTLRVPREELTIPEVPGVYWVGVHALGTDDDGRDSLADGRARTFMPLVRTARPRVDVALVLPLRQTVRRADDGALRDPGDWRDRLLPDGRLERLLGLAESSGGAPFSLLVDPAVLDAVSSLAQSGQGTAADQARAKAWLVRFKGVADAQRVLGLGYADPDVAALARHEPSLLSTAAALSAATFTRDGIAAAPAVAPSDGSLPPRFSDLLPRETTLLLSSAAVTSTASLARTRSGQPLVVSRAAAAAGGPLPTPATWALAMRQRIVAEAALYRDEHPAGAGDPLVVALPPAWDPGPDWASSNFFSGLGLSWLHLVRVGPDAVPATAPTATAVAYSDTLAKAQLSGAQVAAVKDVRRQARIYADALTDPGGVVDQISRLALEGASYHARTGRAAALQQSRQLAESVTARLAGIHVEGFSLVTMSGGTGTFTVTLVNDLKRPVKVGLKARTSGDLRIRTPPAVVLPAGQRTTVRLRANAGQSRVRTVLLTPETTGGYAVGTPLRFSIRNSRVSSLVWAVMAGAFALLLVTIVRRAVKRGLHREPPPL